MNDSKKRFVIAGICIELQFENDDEGFWLAPYLSNFAIPFESKSPVICVKVGSCVRGCRYLKNGTFLCSNGTVDIETFSEGYRCALYNDDKEIYCYIEGNKKYTECRCELLGDANSKYQGLKSALLIIYAHAASYYGRMLLHASVVKHHEKAYCFIGPSGRGKSTQSALWIKNIPDCTILNDDMPVLQVLDSGNVVVHGSPWSGKTDYYVNDSAEMRAMVLMSHGTQNVITKIRGLDCLISILPSCSMFYPDESSYLKILDMIELLLQNYPLYSMSCIPEDAAALMCYSVINGRSGKV